MNYQDMPQNTDDNDGFSFGLPHWLFMDLAVALFNELINKRQEKKMQKAQDIMK